MVSIVGKKEKRMIFQHLLWRTIEQSPVPRLKLKLAPYFFRQFIGIAAVEYITIQGNKLASPL
jgi:hypothetical protein